MLLGQYGSDPEKKTLCVYGHYDVQPAAKCVVPGPPFRPPARFGPPARPLWSPALTSHPATRSDGWDTEPFTLTEVDGRLCGRGSSDDKGA